MPIVAAADANTVSSGGTKIRIAQQGRTANYAQPTDAATALVAAVSRTGKNREVVTTPDLYIKKVYRPAPPISYTYQAQGLENPTFGQSVDRQKPQPGPVDASGDISFINIQAGLEPWLQHLTCDKTPTVALVQSSSTALRYTFTPDNNSLELLTMEIVKGTLPDRSFGVQPNQLSFNLTRNELSTFTFSCLGLDYQLNTAGNTAAAGSATPASAGITTPRTIPVVAEMPATGFAEIPSRGYPGWAARMLNGAGDSIGGSQASFTYNNNFSIAGELIGTQGAARVVREENTFREVSAQLTLPYSRENRGMAYDFIENSDNGPLTIEFRFPISGEQTRRLAFVFGNSIFEEMPEPAVGGSGEIQNPINLRLLPSSTGANDIVRVEYDVLITEATQLQQYAA